MRQILWLTSALIVACVVGTLFGHLTLWLGWPSWVRLPIYVVLGACVGSMVGPVIVKRSTRGEQ